MARNKKEPIPPGLKLKVFKRDGYKCRYCGSMQTPLHCDHVYPQSKGGETTARNLVTACKSCNLKKHAKIGIWPIPLGKEDEIRELERRSMINSFHHFLIMVATIAAIAAFALLLIFREDKLIVASLLILSASLFIIAYIYRVAYRKFFYWN